MESREGKKRLTGKLVWIYCRVWLSDSIVSSAYMRLRARKQLCHTTVMLEVHSSGFIAEGGRRV